MRTTGRLPRRLAAGLAALVMGVTAALAIAAPAQATTTSAPCTTYEMCYWYASGYGGAQTGVYDWAVYDLSNPAVYFYGGGSGSGTRLWNNAGSGANYDYDYCVAVYYSQGYGSPYLYLDSYSYGYWWSYTLDPVNNNNRSQHFWGC